VTVLEGLVLSGTELVPGRVELEGERIARVDLDPGARPAADAPVIAPGLVDLHVHGFGGVEAADDLAAMARALAAAGTTAFQPTLFPAEPARLGALCTRLGAEAEALGEGSASVLGLHLEGPFVNPARAGALPPSDLTAPGPDALRALLGSEGRGAVRTMTVAPELAGADALCAELVRRGVRVSLGHTEATAADARRAARAGASGATHLYNAMRGMHHREAGLVGFAFSDDALSVELIGDLVHVGEEAVAAALAAIGPERLCLVSDALAGAGTGCERFEARGRVHRVERGAAWFEREDGELALAGSATGQMEAVRRLVARGVVSAGEALAMASAAPARALGLEGELGAVAPGARADLMLLEPASLALRGVLLGGRPLALEPSTRLPGDRAQVEGSSGR
jgi:N-acetylglucosamine-6-phosphate deacetylase